MKSLIKKLMVGENLTFNEAQFAMQEMLDGEATEAQIASFLTALRLKGETIDEIAGSADVMKRYADTFALSAPYHVDTVGTGGDGVNTFNITTACAFVTAAGGVTVAKHGNRAVSSGCGSVDVLEALGIDVMLEAENVKQCIEQNGLGFMFARVFHKKLGKVSKVRGELSIRTIFNILGPLSNPSNAKGQLIGVFEERLVVPLAEAMVKLGVEKAMVVHGKDGLDEISTTAETVVAEIKDGKVLSYTLSPEQFHLPRVTVDDIRGGTAVENATVIEQIFEGKLKGAKLDIVALNAGASLYIGKKADSVKEGVGLAFSLIQSGKALEKLHALRAFTKGANV